MRGSLAPGGVGTAVRMRELGQKRQSTTPLEPARACVHRRASGPASSIRGKRRREATVGASCGRRTRFLYTTAAVRAARPARHELLAASRTASVHAHWAEAGRRLDASRSKREHREQRRPKANLARLAERECAVSCSVVATLAPRRHAGRGRSEGAPRQLAELDAGKQGWRVTLALCLPSRTLRFPPASEREHAWRRRLCRPSHPVVRGNRGQLHGDITRAIFVSSLVTTVPWMRTADSAAKATR